MFFFIYDRLTSRSRYYTSHLQPCKRACLRMHEVVARQFFYFFKV